MAAIVEARRQGQLMHNERLAGITTLIDGGASRQGSSLPRRALDGPQARTSHRGVEETPPRSITDCSTAWCRNGVVGSPPCRLVSSRFLDLLKAQRRALQLLLIFQDVINVLQEGRQHCSDISRLLQALLVRQLVKLDAERRVQ